MVLLFCACVDGKATSFFISPSCLRSRFSVFAVVFFTERLNVARFIFKRIIQRFSSFGVICVCENQNDVLLECTFPLNSWKNAYRCEYYTLYSSQSLS